MPSEDGDGVVHRGPLTMAILNKKQIMPSEDGNGWSIGFLLRWLSAKGSKICHPKMGGGVINWGPLTIATLKFQFTLMKFSFGKHVSC